MGLAGSGKGTQGDLLAKKINYEYFSTGEYLRSYITGKRKQEMLQGKLIDDHEMVSIITSFLDSLESKNRSILDGFPRTLDQAKWLLEKAKKDDFEIEGIIYLNVEEAELIDRLISRGRPDDTTQAIKKRFDLYKRATAPVIEHYRQNDVPVFEIPGSDAVEVIHDYIIKQINRS